MEVLTAAAGTMGSVILPAVFDAIAREPDTGGAWCFLWDLTVLGAKTDDEDLRSRVVRECAELLERIDRGQADPVDGVQAAWTLAALQCTQYTDLIERLISRSSPSFFAADYEDALKLLQGRLEFTPLAELWEQPVEEWLAPRCRSACEWEEEDGDYEDEYLDETEDLDEIEDQNEDKDRMRASLMAASFCYSPVAMAMPRELRDHASFIVEELLYNSFVYLDLAPARWDESAMRELLLDIVPRKLLADVGVLEMVVPVTEAFLYWLQFEGLVPGIAVLTQTIHGWTDQIVAAGNDPRNWNSNKRYIIESMENGLNPRDPQREQTFMDQQFHEYEEALAKLEPQKRKETREPTIPIVEYGSKVARNAPCPCGSGRKYKKCCGRSETTASGS
ncbi:MAG: SEC-C domain-containing protein [Phycisphaerae bacterium]|nr:SEC-C domain-containing protein [Phycisphaerae bacterium]